MRKTLIPGLLAVALLASPVLAEEIVYFSNGTAMPIKSYRIEKGMVHVDLGGNGAMAFPESMVDRIEKDINSSAEKEVAAAKVGEMIMEELKNLDVAF